MTFFDLSFTITDSIISPLSCPFVCPFNLCAPLLYWKLERTTLVTIYNVVTMETPVKPVWSIGEGGGRARRGSSEETGMFVCGQMMRKEMTGGHRRWLRGICTIIKFICVRSLPDNTKHIALFRCRWESSCYLISVDCIFPIFQICNFDP